MTKIAMTEQLGYKPSLADMNFSRRGVMRGGVAGAGALALHLAVGNEVLAQEVKPFMIGSVDLTKRFIEMVGPSAVPMDPRPQKTAQIDQKDIDAFNNWQGQGWNDTLIFETSMPNVHVIYAHTRNHMVKDRSGKWVKAPLPNDWIRHTDKGGAMALAQENGKTPNVAKLEVLYGSKPNPSSVEFWSKTGTGTNGRVQFAVGESGLVLPAEVTGRLRQSGGIIFAGCGEIRNPKTGHFDDQRFVVTGLYQ